VSLKVLQLLHLALLDIDLSLQVLKLTINLIPIFNLVLQLLNLVKLMVATELRNVSTGLDSLVPRVNLPLIVNVAVNVVT